MSRSQKSKKDSTRTSCANATEKRLLRAFLDDDLPDWVLGFRISTKEEDHRMIDSVCITDVGEFFIQVKSSRRGARGFEANLQKRVPNEEIRFRYLLIIVTLRSQHDKIRQEIIDQIANKRRVLLNLREST